jgi:hypothetical protein
MLHRPILQDSAGTMGRSPVDPRQGPRDLSSGPVFHNEIGNLGKIPQVS